jgi:hypothetical protein
MEAIYALKPSTSSELDEPLSISISIAASSPLSHQRIFSHDLAVVGPQAVPDRAERARNSLLL